MIEEILSGAEAVSTGIRERDCKFHLGCRENLESSLGMRDRDYEPEEVKGQLTC